VRKKLDRQRRPGGGEGAPGRGPVPTYRIYFIEGDGRVQLGETLDAPSDPQAVARFEAMDRNGLTAELWQGGRLVRKLPRDKG
jgi:hypothetical protein